MCRIFLFVLLLGLVSCTESSPTEYANLPRYLSDVGKFQSRDFDGVLVLQTGICGSCDVSVLSLVEEVFSKSPCRHLVIMASRDDDIIKRLQSIHPYLSISVDTMGLLPRYGLRRARDTYYELRDGDVESSIDLHPSEISKVKSSLLSLDCFRRKLVGVTNDLGSGEDCQTHDYPQTSIRFHQLTLTVHPKVGCELESLDKKWKST